MSATKTWDEPDALELVRHCVARELSPGTPLPEDDRDLAQTEVVDSMGWVGILSAIEEATGMQNFANPWPPGHPQSIRVLAQILSGKAAAVTSESTESTSSRGVESSSAVSIRGWGYALGSLTLTADQVEREVGLDPGTLQDRAGIQSVRRAAESETEITLAQRAAQAAIDAATIDVDQIGLLVSTSTTFLHLPGLAATLHSRLLLGEAAMALEVGGACVGLIHALRVCDFFEYAHKGALKIKGLTTSKRPETEKSHKLSV